MSDVFGEKDLHGYEFSRNRRARLSWPTAADILCGKTQPSVVYSINNGRWGGTLGGLEIFDQRDSIFPLLGFVYSSKMSTLTYNNQKGGCGNDALNLRRSKILTFYPLLTRLKRVF